MILIALNGYKGSDKNTVARFIAQWGESRGLVVVERAFAELLKLSAARSLGLIAATNINDAVVLMDSLKESGYIEIAIPGQSIQKAITGREFLKYYGTEGHRDVFGNTFWIDQVLPLPMTGDDWQLHFRLRGDVFADIAVVTDCRFANEARRVKELGGQIWNVDRGFDADEHASEQPLPVDLIDLHIKNFGTLESLEVEVRTWMTAEFHMKFVEKPDPLAYE